MLLINGAHQGRPANRVSGNARLSCGTTGRTIFFPQGAGGSLWRNRLARSAVNRKVGGSSPPSDG